MILDDLKGRLARDGSLLLSLKVTAKSSRSEIAAIQEDGTLRVRIAAAPEKGKANEEIRSFLASLFGTAKARVEILSGATSPHKRVRISL